MLCDEIRGSLYWKGTLALTCLACNRGFSNATWKALPTHQRHENTPQHKENMKKFKPAFKRDDDDNAAGNNFGGGGSGSNNYGGHGGGSSGSAGRGWKRGAYERWERGNKKAKHRHWNK